MADEPEIEVVVTDEPDDEASRRRQFPLSYKNTPEDDLAELRLRALMPRLHDREHPEFSSITPIRAGVPAHTDRAAAAALKEVANLVAEDDDTIALTATARAYLDGLVDNGGRSDPKQITRGERYRRSLVEADEGHLVRGRFAEFWEEVEANAR